MRRIGITALAALYTLLIVSITVARTSVWANQESDAIGHFCGADGAPRITHLEKSDSPPSQKKWVESGFAVELPQEASLDPAPSNHAAALPIPEYRSSLNGLRVSSRGPPARS